MDSFEFFHHHSFEFLHQQQDKRRNITRRLLNGGVARWQPSFVSKMNSPRKSTVSVLVEVSETIPKNIVSFTSCANDVTELEFNVRKKFKSIDTRLRDTREFEFQRLNEISKSRLNEREWVVIGDDSPIKDLEKVELLIHSSPVLIVPVIRNLSLCGSAYSESSPSALSNSGDFDDK